MNHKTNHKTNAILSGTVGSLFSFSGPIAIKQASMKIGSIFYMGKEQSAEIAQQAADRIVEESTLLGDIGAIAALGTAAIAFFTCGISLKKHFEEKNQSIKI